LEAIFKKLTLC